MNWVVRPICFVAGKFQSEELGVRLAEAGYPIGPVQQLEILERTPSGRAASVSVRE